MPPAVEQNDIGSQDLSHEYKLDDPNSEASQQSPATRDAHDQAQSSPRPGSVHIPFLDRLRALPEVRSIPWRPGQELPPERSIDSPRVQQRGAILLSTRGRRAEKPCEHCAAGYGRFSVCITLEHWFQGACSSCIFTSKGNKCSLRFQTSGTADGRALRYHTDNPEVLQSYIRNAAEHPKPSKKRKRRSAPSQMQPTVDPSHASSYPSGESPLAVSPDLDTLLQAEIAREQSSGQHDIFHHHTEKKQQKQHNPSQPNVARVRGPAKTLLNTADPSPFSNEARKLVTDASSPRDLAPLPTERNWPVHQALVEKKSVTPGSAPRPDLSGNVNAGSTPMIDTLPKATQRKIYAGFSGLQGGIDHLQRQLDSLKALLGIDVEDTTGSQ